MRCMPLLGFLGTIIRLDSSLDYCEDKNNDHRGSAPLSTKILDVPSSVWNIAGV